MKRTILAAVLALLAIAASPSGNAAQSSACAPIGALNFICGVPAPEDLVLVPNTQWLIASGMVAGSGLHLIDTKAKTAHDLYGAGASSARADRSKYPSCPGPLDQKQAILHGLSLRPAQALPTGE